MVTTWHDIIHMMWCMELWCTLPMVKPINSLIGCILIFKWNRKMYMLGYVQTDSIHSVHLLHHIFIGWWYLRLITYHHECVYGWSSCSYLRSYSILIVLVGILMLIFDHWLMSWNSYGHPRLWHAMSRGNKIFW